MKSENRIKYFSLIVFTILTFILSLVRVPFWDEARAFLISQLSFSEIFQLTRIDGHPAAWYLIVKLITSYKTYPYPFLVLNWVLCLISLKILWDSAPFKPIYKVFITFSCIFCFYFAIVARGYTPVLVLLFLICALYSKRFKKPYLFSFLIVLCANFELVGAIFCFWVGVVYLFELYKKSKFKKVFYKVFSIFSLGAVLFLAQMIGESDYNLLSIYKKTNFENFSKHVFASDCRVVYILFFICFVCLFSYYLFKKNKKIATIVLGTFLTYAGVFLFVYLGSFWNYHFFYVYLILACWLGYKTLTRNKVLSIFFVLILIYNLPINRTYRFNNLKMIYRSKSYKIAEIILKNPKYKNAKLYALDFWSDISPGADIFLRRRNINIYGINGDLKNSFENIKNVYKIEHEKIKLKDIYSTFDKNRDNYILINRDLTYKNILPDKHYIIQIVEFNKDAQFAICKILKK